MQITVLRDELKEIEDKLEETYLSVARERITRCCKDFGTTSIVDGDNVLTMTVAKKVTWDQAALLRVFNSMTPDDANHYAKVTYAVESVNTLLLHQLFVKCWSNVALQKLANSLLKLRNKSWD